MKNTNFIEIELSLEDYKKVMNLDEFDIEKKMLQTSAAQYIHISLRPERSKREDSHKLVYREPDFENMTPQMKAKYEKAKEIVRCGTLNIVETQ